MAGTVQVTFGANIAPLVEGVESARKAIESFMAAFAVDRLAEFAEAYAKMGEEIERSSAMLGASTTQVQQLGYIAKMTGSDQEGLSAAIERFQLNLQRAQNPTSQQALALKALGLSARDLIGLPLSEQLGRMADAISKFADGGNKTALVMALLGRTGADMIPLLDQGSSGFASMSDQAERTGAVISGQTVVSLAHLDSAATGLKASLSALGAELVGLASGALTSFTDGLAQSTGTMTKLIETGQIGSYTMQYLEAFVVELVAQLGKLGTALVDIFTGNWGAKFTADMKAADAIIANTARTSVNELDAKLKSVDASYRQLLNTAGQGSNKPQAPAMDVMDRDTLSAMMSNINAQVAAQNTYYTQQADHINELAKTYQITEEQKTAMLLAAVNQREAMQQAELQQGMNLQGLTASQYQKFQDELTKVEQKAALDRQKIEEAAVAEYQKDWQSALNTIESSFNSQLRGLLAGTETWQMAWRKVLGDMIIRFIEMCEQMVVKWAAAQLAQTTATITGATARATAENSASAAGMLGMLGNAIKAIMTDAAQVFGGVFAFLAPTMGPTAAAPAAAAQASVLAAVPALAVGTDYVTHGGFALLHAGEKVTPAQTSGPYSGADASSIKGLLASHREQMGQMTDAVSRSMGGLENEFYQLRRKLGR